MIRAFNIISLGIVPFILFIVVLHGYIKKINIYDAFVKGAIEGLKTSIKIIPYLIAIFVAIGIFKSSQAMDYMVHIFQPIFSIFGVPEEILPLILMRPISGSGALAVVREIMSSFGPDSFPGMVSGVMMGSSETIFYTMALYYGSIGIEDHRHTLKASMISYFLSIIVSVFICNIFFYGK
jgi:spore maturation protein B